MATESLPGFNVHVCSVCRGGADTCAFYHQVTKYHVESISFERNVLGPQRLHGLARCLLLIGYCRLCFRLSAALLCWFSLYFTTCFGIHGHLHAIFMCSIFYFHMFEGFCFAGDKQTKK
jgi:hypothetical protein